MAPAQFRLTLPLLLSLNAGFVDTAGFLALQGLFTAHVTGNFVTLGASLVLGTSGAVAKLLALPVFCVVVMAVRPYIRTFDSNDYFHQLASKEICVAIAWSSDYEVAQALAVEDGTGDQLLIEEPFRDEAHRPGRFFQRASSWLACWVRSATSVSSSSRACRSSCSIRRRLEANQAIMSANKRNATNNGRSEGSM